MITAVFPRMMGKARPGVVVRVIDEDGRAAGIVATPMTTVRTNQAGRIAVAADSDRGVERACWLLLPSTSVLPISAILERRGDVANRLFVELDAAMSEWFGRAWRQTDPALARPIKRARPLHPKRRRR
ncbi:MAG: hypothetical protein AAFQ73_15955 [Pseudomonadota bacterium]